MEAQGRHGILRLVMHPSSGVNAGRFCARQGRVSESAVPGWRGGAARTCGWGTGAVRGSLWAAFPARGRGAGRQTGRDLRHGTVSGVPGSDMSTVGAACCQLGWHDLDGESGEDDAGCCWAARRFRPWLEAGAGGLSRPAPVDAGARGGAAKEVADVPTALCRHCTGGCDAKVGVSRAGSPLLIVADVEVQEELGSDGGETRPGAASRAGAWGAMGSGPDRESARALSRTVTTVRRIRRLSAGTGLRPACEAPEGSRLPQLDRACLPQGCLNLVCCHRPRVCGSCGGRCHRKM